MIAGAWFVRTKIIDGKTPSVTTTQPSGTDAPANGSRELICIPELAEVCRASGSAYREEAAGTTFAKLVSPTQADFVWMSLSPWPEMVDSARVRAGLPPIAADRRKALASTTVVLAAPTDRVAVLKTACSDMAWKCLGEKMNRPWKDIAGPAGWQDVTFRHRDPLSSASGLSVLGAALAGRTGRTDLSSSDLAANDVRSWATQLEDTNKQPSSDPLTSVLVGTRFDVVGALATEVPTTGRAATLEPMPVARVSATLMATSGNLSNDLATSLSGALGKNGWQPGVAASGLPDAVGMEAVQRLWQEVIR